MLTDFLENYFDAFIKRPSAKVLSILGLHLIGLLSYYLWLCPPYILLSNSTPPFHLTLRKEAFNTLGAFKNISWVLQKENICRAAGLAHSCHQGYRAYMTGKPSVTKKGQSAQSEDLRGKLYARRQFLQQI